MGVSVRQWWPILRDTVNEWIEDNAMRLAGALAYYSMFSLAPMLVIAVSIAGIFFDAERTSGQLQRQLTAMLGDEAAGGVLGMIENARMNDSGPWATLLSVATLLFGATGVIVALKDSMNTVWGVVADPDRSWWVMIRDRLLSLGLVLGVGFLLMVSLLLTTVLQAMGSYVERFMSLPLAVLINTAVNFVVITLLFAMIFKLLPDVIVRWSDVWVGAALTAILFILGKYLIGLYLGSTAVGSTYGAAGSLAVVLIWVYYSSLILFFGAEFTQVYARAHGSHIEPSRGALPMTEALRRQEELARKNQRQKAATRSAPDQADQKPSA